jgi:hypothetical protein
MSKNTRRLTAIAFAGVFVGLATAVADTPSILAVKPLLVDGIEYRAEYEFRAEIGNPATLHAGIEARDAKTGRALWRSNAYTISTSFRFRSAGKDVPGDPIKELSPFAHGVLVTTQSGAILFLDPKTKSTELVRDRRCKSAVCEVDQRQLKGEIVKTPHGIADLPPFRLYFPTWRQPHAYMTPVSGECCIMERNAAFLYCEVCRYRAEAYMANPYNYGLDASQW